jgi:cell division protein FtsN
MARDVRRGNERSGGRSPGSTISFITGVLVGLTAATVYFKLNGAPLVPPSLSKAAPAEQAAATNPSAKPDAAPTATEPAPPKPTFDFYKILPGSEVKVPDNELTEPQPAPDSTPEPASYLLQVGAYQKFEEADQIKAQLALQGISSTIQKVVNKGHEVWYRVNVGPLTGLEEVQSMRARLVEGGAKVVVVKQGAGQ